MKNLTQLPAMLISAIAVLFSNFATAADFVRPEFTTLVAHWTDYGTPDYLSFIREAQPDVAQVGFYGAHFYSLAHTPQYKGYPAHFPVQGLNECGEWFRQLNASLHEQPIKVVGHFNIKFLVGEPDGPDGPRGFFKFYRDLWDEKQLGPKPVKDPLDLLEKNADGTPIIDHQYKIGGMPEYWGCLNNPHWRKVLKAWAKQGIAAGVDGYMINYFYRHNCLCTHCRSAFKEYMGDRFTPGQLKEQFGIDDLSQHEFNEIVGWHKPDESTPLRREMLRFSQVANKRAFDDVFEVYARSLKPDLIVGQWNHLGDFSQIAGDERCMLPGDLWGRGEDYLWYSSGGSACYTDLAEGYLGDITLQARYVRGAFDDKPFTFGKYEQTRIRAAISELAANGGAPMGFYTRFTDPAARAEIVRYYQFLHRYDGIFRANRSHAEALLIFPRNYVHEGQMTALAAFKKLGRRLLDEHVLFDVKPDDLVTAADRDRYRQVFEVSASDTSAEKDAPGAESSPDVKIDWTKLSTVKAPQTVRVSCSRPASGDELTLHLVNYNREEPAKKKSPGTGIADERPVAVSDIAANLILPAGFRATRMELVTPESPEPRVLEYRQNAGRVEFTVPEFLVYAVVRIALASEAGAEVAPPATESKPLKVAALVSSYYSNSHADAIVSRLLKTDTLDGRGGKFRLELASLFVDQLPDSDTSKPRRPDVSRDLVKGTNVRLSDTVADALTLGTGRLAVDGVLLVFEGGDYPRSSIDSIEYPKRKYFDQVVQVFESSGRVVPVFIDKHLSDNWTDIKAVYDTAQRLKIPLMSGSTLPITWRYPAVDTRRDAPLKDMVVISYHLLDVYGFHAIELLQALVERRPGDERGIKSVQCLSGDDVWKAGEEGVYDPKLLAKALARQRWKPSRAALPLPEQAKKPVLFIVDYVDGLRANVLTLDGAVGNWAAAWRYQDGHEEATHAWVQDTKPLMHFTYLLRGVEEMVVTGKAPWPIERNLLTGGMLAALLTSRRDGGTRVDTPELMVPYRSEWNWHQPPEPPVDRPLSGP